MKGPSLLGDCHQGHQGKLLSVSEVIKLNGWGSQDQGMTLEVRVCLHSNTPNLVPGMTPLPERNRERPLVHPKTHGLVLALQGMRKAWGGG